MSTSQRNEDYSYEENPLNLDDDRMEVDDIRASSSRKRTRPDSPESTSRSKSPPNKVVPVAREDWQAHGQELHTLTENLDDAKKKRSGDRKLIEALKRKVDELGEEKRSLETALLGSKGETEALLKTNATLQDTCRSLAEKTTVSSISDGDAREVVLTEEEVKRLTEDIKTQAEELQAVKNSLSQKDQKISSLEKELQNQGEEVLQLRQQNQGYMAELEEAQEVEETRRHLQEEVEEENDNQESLDNLKTQLRAMADEKDRLILNAKQLREEHEQMIEENNATIASKESLLRDFTNDIAETRRSANELQSKYDTLNQEHTTTAQELENERAARKSSATELQTQYNTLSKKHSEAEDAWGLERAKLQTERNLSESSATGLQTKYDVLSKEKTEAEDAWGLERAKLQTERDLFKSSAAGLQTKYDALSKEKTEAEDAWRLERAKLQTERDSSKNSATNLQSEYNALNKEYKDAQHAWRLKREELQHSLAMSKADAENERTKELETQILELKGNLTSEVKSKSASWTRHQTEIQKLEGQIREQRHEGKCLTEDNHQLKTELSNQKASTATLKKQIQSLESVRRDMETQNRLLKETVDLGSVSRPRYDEVANLLEKEESKTLSLEREIDKLRKESTSESSKEIQQALRLEIEGLKAQLDNLPKVSSSSSSSNASMEAEIERLKSSLNSVKQDAKNEKKALEQKILSQTAEIDSLKNAGDPGEASLAEIYATTRSTRRYLSRANVPSALHEARRRYGLKEGVLFKGNTNDEAYSADSERDSPVVHIHSNKHRKARGSAFLIKERNPAGSSVAKGKRRQVDAPSSSSSDQEDVHTDNDVESKIGRTREVYGRKGVHANWTENEQKNSADRLLRTQLREMLNVRTIKQAHQRPGVERKDPDRFEKFQKDPATHGPGLHCTYLHTDGGTIEELMEDEWNQMFILTLSKECEGIAKDSRDHNRFLKMDWLELARARVYRILLEVARSKPRQGETRKEALARIVLREEAILERAKNTSSRHTKFELRQQIVTVMIEYCKEQGQAGTEGVAFWQWVLNLLHEAGHEFMSDEETSSVLDEKSAGRAIAITVKKVLALKWRNPYFTKLFIFLDDTTGVEEMIFQKSGHPSLKRFRIQTLSSWPAPSGRPASFYAPVYLASLTEPQKAGLKIQSAEFVLRSFEGYID